mmetsp:Transcript_1566/g.3365  ORF Transcript_1566/g.3365 Transcript_1566/m.3365 type:complete len:80 (-) Transcript_1566:122-361(-)
MGEEGHRLIGSFEVTVKDLILLSSSLPLDRSLVRPGLSSLPLTPSKEKATADGGTRKTFLLEKDGRRCGRMKLRAEFTP